MGQFCFHPEQIETTGVHHSALVYKPNDWQDSKVPSLCGDKLLHPTFVDPYEDSERDRGSLRRRVDDGFGTSDLQEEIMLLSKKQAKRRHPFEDQRQPSTVTSTRSFEVDVDRAPAPPAPPAQKGGTGPSSPRKSGLDEPSSPTPKKFEQGQSSGEDVQSAPDASAHTSVVSPVHSVGSPTGTGVTRQQASQASERGATAASHNVDPARRKLFVQVAEENYKLRFEWQVPKTQYCAYRKSAAAISRLKRRPKKSKVSFSDELTSDSLISFAKASKPGSVCGLNFANGINCGGGYKNGSIAQEEDLCRRIPNLFTSLNNARQDGMYPFGPSTCSDMKDPRKYSDVLFTPDLCLARGGETMEFLLLPKEAQQEISLVSAAAPNIKFGNDIVDDELMYKTITSILVAPLLHNPQITILVLGAWGCGAFGGDPARISALFAKALLSKELGSLYETVHFAIPMSSDNNSNVFKQTLRRCKVDFTET